MQDLCDGEDNLRQPEIRPLEVVGCVRFNHQQNLHDAPPHLTSLGISPTAFSVSMNCITSTPSPSDHKLVWPMQTDNYFDGETFVSN